MRQSQYGRVEYTRDAVGVVGRRVGADWGRRVLAVWLLAAVLLASLLPLPVSASEASGSGDGNGKSFVERGSIPRPQPTAGDARNVGVGVWAWPQGRLVYHLIDDKNAQQSGFSHIAAYDLGSGEQVERAPLEFPAYDGRTAGSESPGQPHHVAVDGEGGRLFVAYERGLADQAGVVSRGEACVPVGRGATLYAPQQESCVAGVQVLDARSLERIGPLMPLRVVSTLRVPISAHLLAMEFSPSRGEGDADKVLMLVSDHVAGTPGAGGPGAVVRVAASFNPTYVVQFDVDSGRQDWVVALDACRGTRNSRDSVQNDKTRNAPDPAAVFRRRGLADPMVVAACHNGSNQTGTVVRIPLDAQGNPAELPVRVAQPEPSDASEAEPQAWVAQSPTALVSVGPDRVIGMIADPLSDRVLLRVIDGPFGQLAEVWWVYDVALGQFIGTIGIGGPVDWATARSAFDPTRGRLYVLAHPMDGWPGGLFLADVRRTPVAQALAFPEFGGWTFGEANGVQDSLGVVPPGDDGTWPLLLIPAASVGVSRSTGYRVLEDRVAMSADPVDGGFEGRSLDLDEIQGVTGVSLDGAARGYGARALLVGGAEAAARVGPADPLGMVFQCNGSFKQLVGMELMPCGSTVSITPTAWTPETEAGSGPSLPEGCTSSSPEVVLGFVGPDGPNVVDGSGSRGGAQPVLTDSATSSDLEAPTSRCSGTDWERVGTVPILGGVPLTTGLAEEPQVTAPWAGRGVDCVSGKDSEERSGDPVASYFAAATTCGDEDASGFAYARGSQVGDLGVGEALSSFRIYRDPGRGIVSRVESVARGIHIAGALRIDTVRGTAESWANGRRFTPPEGEDAQSYDPNCDLERTAGTCFRRHVFGVWTPGYQCGPCGDEQRLVDGMGRALGANGKATFREPDAVLARGADNGFQAAITKPAEERFADLVLNNDLLQTVLPTLEIVRYANANRVPSGGGARGRQVYQFAGVEVSSSYSIQCLLVYDEEANTCGLPAEVPGSIQVSLSDPDGEPLAGGAFEVRQDVDADGVLGLADTLLPDGACVTAEDGVGTCTFDNLQPGPYLVSQVAAPPGYAKSSEPWVSEVASGEQRIVAFTNVSNVSMIDMTVTDDAGAPVSGAAFAAYPDPDADGKVAPDAQPAATCTTDADGVCAMQVPAGSYVLVQTSAPGGLEGIEPVAFTFASGGQTAAVGVVNYPPDSPQAPEGAVSPISYTPPVDQVSPSEFVDDGYVAAPVIDQPRVSVPERIGGTVTQVIRAPGDALRLLARDPKQAIAWTAALALLALAVMAVRQRALVSRLTLAPVGGPPPAPPGGGSAGLGAGPSGGRPRPSPTPKKPSGGPGAGHRGGPGERPPGGGPTRYRRPGGVSAGPKASSAAMPDTRLASATQTATLLDERMVAGGAPAAVEQVSPRVVVATALPGLSAVVTRRLADSDSCDVLAVVDSIEALRAAVAEQRPDVLVVDLGLVSGGAADVCDLLPQFHPLARTVGLIPPNRSAEALAVRGYGCGLGGLLVADEDLTNGQLAYAVRCVASGKIFFGPTVQALLLAQPRSASSERQHANRLSRRELEVARLAAAGAPRTEIAKRLFVTPSTVKTQLRAIRAKLGVTDPRDPVQLRQRLDELGLLEQSGDPEDR